MIHARRGASKFKRLIECPGSELLSANVPDEPSAAAAEGTLAHAAAENFILHNHWPVDTSDEMKRHLTHYVKYAQWRIMQAGKENVQVEARVTLDPFGFKEMFGTADLLIKDWPGRMLEVVDLKYGAGVYVDEVENAQLRFYALGALGGLTPEEVSQIDTVRTTICQPRNGTTAPRSEEFTVLELVDEFCGVVADTVARLDRQRLDALDLKVGEHCRFCPARRTCPELKAKASERATMVFEAKHIQALETMTPETIAEELAMIDALTGWIKSLKVYAAQTAQRGTPIPGHKVIQSKGHRAFTDEGSVREILTMFGHEDEMLTEPKLRTPAQIEDLVSLQVWPLVEKYVKAPVTGYRLVPDHKRGTPVEGPLDPSVVFKDE